MSAHGEPDGPAIAASGDDTSDQLREALKFLSHDAREGHSSTLALLELQRVRAEPSATGETAQRIERNARRSLRRIDDFVAYARARSQVLQIEDVELLDLLFDAAAEAWHAANERGVRLQVGQAPSGAQVRADRGLLNAAITRLIQHALDRCQRGSDLICAVRESAQSWSLELDEAASAGGSAQVDASAAPVAAPVVPPGDDRHGWGLVELVVTRLGGTLQRPDATEKGVRLRVTLPRA